MALEVKDLTLQELEKKVIAAARIIANPNTPYRYNMNVTWDQDKGTVDIHIEAVK
jgi:hypothetical protein